MAVSPVESSLVQLDYNFDAESGGVSQNGKFYWMVAGNELQIFRLPSGTRSAHWTFTGARGDQVSVCPLRDM